MSSTYNHMDEYQNSCPVIFALRILSKKWLIPIICQLNKHGVMRFNALLRAVDGINSMMLTQCLKELQSLGIISREQFNEMPLRVEYALTDMGRNMLPSVFALSRWSVQMMDAANVDHHCACTDQACQANVEHTISIRQDDINLAYKKWDESYIAMYQQLNDSPETKRLDPIEKMAMIMRFNLRATVEDGEELSRMRTIYYIIGNDKSDEVIAEIDRYVRF